MNHGLFVVSYLEVLLDRHSDPEEIASYLLGRGAEKVESVNGRLFVRMAPFVYCLCDCQQSKAQTFQMFHVDANKIKVPVDRGTIRCGFRHVTGAPSEFFVDGGVCRVCNITIADASPEDLAHLRIADQKVDETNEIEVLKGMLSNPETHPIDTAKLIEELLFKKGHTSTLGREGHVQELSFLTAYSTSRLNILRATLRLHPKLQDLLNPSIPEKSRLRRDFVPLLVKLDQEGQWEAWNKLANIKGGIQKRYALRRFVHEYLK